MKAYLKNFFTSFLSLAPVIILVFVFHFSGLITLATEELAWFGIGSGFMLVGIPLFTFFAESSMEEIGKQFGSHLAKSKSLAFIMIVAFILGFFFTMAEPDLKILAEQTPFETMEFVMIVSAGVAVMFIIGTLRILLNLNLKIVLLLLYLICFGLCMMLENAPGSLPIIFDAGGSTTGSISVPLILAMGAGLSTTVKRKHNNNNTFGLSGIVSVGPLIIMVITYIFAGNSTGVTTPVTGDIGTIVGHYVLEAFIDSLIAFGPILIIYVIYAKVFIKTSWKNIGVTLFGFIFIIIGLILFLSGANIGFLKIGPTIGQYVAENPYNKFIMLPFVAAIGAIIAFAEPAIKILAKQIEDVSEGSIKSRTILIALAIAIAAANVLSFIRIIYNINFIHMIIPIYLVIFILMFVVDSKYVGIAFDAGAICSGTMTTAFTSPLALGYAVGLGATCTVSPFGILAMVSSIPILAIELIGIHSKVRQKIAYVRARNRIKDENENQVIHFE